MLRAGYELTGLELDASGVARAIRGLRAALERRDDVAVVPLAHPTRPRAPKGRVARGLAREAVYFPLTLPRRAAALGLDVLHCPVGLAPRRTPVPLVVTVNDAMALDHPEWFTAANVRQQRHLLAPALRRAATVLAPSAHAAERVADAFAVPRERIRVIPYGIGPAFSPGAVPDGLRERLGLHDDPWLLTVGALQPRKNVDGVLRAFERLHARGLPHRLIVAGARGWRDEALARRLRDSPAARAVLPAGRVSDEDLIGLYRGADAFLFPSRYEGFGFPPLEAMACGAPVVCAERASLPEVAGDAALLVDPDDDAQIAAAIERALDPATAADLRARGPLHAARFTWERCAALTVEAYREAAGGAGPARAG